MKSASLFTIIGLSFSTAYADTSYDLKTVITPQKFDVVVQKLMHSFGDDIQKYDVKVNGIQYSGYFTLTDDGYLSSVAVTSIFAKMSAKVSIIPINSDVNAHVFAIINDLNCNTPEVTSFDVKISNSIIDKLLNKDSLKKDMPVIVRDYIIGQSDLINYCKIKPLPQQSKFEFSTYFSTEGW